MYFKATWGRGEGYMDIVLQAAQDRASECSLR